MVLRHCGLRAWGAAQLSLSLSLLACMTVYGYVCTLSKDSRHESMSATGPWSAERDGRWIRRDGEQRVGWDEGGGWNRVSCACLVDLWGHVDRDKVEVVFACQLLAETTRTPATPIAARDDHHRATLPATLPHYALPTRHGFVNVLSLRPSRPLNLLGLLQATPRQLGRPGSFHIRGTLYSHAM